jgi:adenine-specific DNA-methyltransferase
MAKERNNATGDKNSRVVDAYTHDKVQRTNNPTVGMAQYDTATENLKSYQFDPFIEPELQWAGKNEGLSFSVPTSSIHIHESIKPHKIIKAVQNLEYDEQIGQLGLFESPMQERRNAIEFYQHGVAWTNRMIAGDSLVIMNSLLEKEGMAGQVQMVYIDPPYGIKYGSNFQPFIDNRDVKDKKDSDLSQEPEMIKAFRDTWELGIHSYLSYLRNRLLLSRELLNETGSVFVQISDENIHLVRQLCDEVFGTDNYCRQIFFKKTTGQATKLLTISGDFYLWYAKDKEKIKYRQLYTVKDTKQLDSYTYIESPDGLTWRKMSKDEINDNRIIPSGWRIFSPQNLRSQGFSSNSTCDFEFMGRTFHPGKTNHWKTTPEGLRRLASAKRLLVLGNSINYKRYFDDYPVIPISELWMDTAIAGFSGEEKLYVVQTATKAVQRCMLMTTDPGDLVLDITCGSGTTAFVAEQWGRRWITCDTSRVAITLAKQRLMTATFDYYKLAHPDQGVDSGFVFKTVPHITLKSIATDEPSNEEIIYDQPQIDKSRTRVSGPFTVEALPAPVVKPLEDVVMVSDNLSKIVEWQEELKVTGILTRQGEKIEFSRIESLSGTTYLQAEAETKESKPRRAVICFATETKPLDSRMVKFALDEAENLRPSPKLIIFAAFQFDPEAAKDIDETNWPGINLLKVQMNTDLMTEDLKKKRISNQSFWLVGQPDIKLVKLEKGKEKGLYKVFVNGFDYYDVRSGSVESGNSDRIAMWMLDTDYDGMCIEPEQVFFPLGGRQGGWNKLAKTLRAEINLDLIEMYEGVESLPFSLKLNSQIAVKIIDDRGIESMKVLRVRESS